MEYKRILLKLSGEALMGEQQYGIDPKRIQEYAEDIKAVVDKGVEMAIVIGGGNIFRGLKGVGQGMDRVWYKLSEMSYRGISSGSIILK